MIHRTPFIANSRVSLLGVEEGKKNDFFPHFELINRTEGQAVSGQRVGVEKSCSQAELIGNRNGIPPPIPSENV